MASKMERPEVTALRARASVERCVRLASQVCAYPHTHARTHTHAQTYVSINHMLAKRLR
jgi:hypothetical protein